MYIYEAYLKLGFINILRIGIGHLAAYFSFTYVLTYEEDLFLSDSFLGSSRWRASTAAASRRI